MKKLLLLLALLPTTLEAQTVRAERFTFANTGCVLRSGSGDPNTVVVGNVCDTFWRTDTGSIYVKTSGTATTTVWTAGVTGTGTANTITKWTGTSTIGNSTSITEYSSPFILKLAPPGDLELDPVGNDVLPTTGYDINIGMLTKKFLSLHAAELWVETLVAQDTIATIGGRVLVAPTTLLTADLASGATSITVKHSNLNSGDIVYLEANMLVEFMTIVASTGGSAGAYTYSVTRNLDGTGANNWAAGDAILNTGQTGNGFIDLYSTRGLRRTAADGSTNNGTEIGPTIVGNIRQSSTFNDWAPRWAIGNLNGLYGYSSNLMGVAFGPPAGARVQIDGTNGIRIWGGDNDMKVEIDTSGNATFDGNITVGTGRNLVRNSNCSVTTEDWTYGTNTGLPIIFDGPWPAANNNFALGSRDNDCYMSITGTPAAGTISQFFGGGNEPATLGFPAFAGQRYEGSAYLGVHRSGNTRVILQFLNAALADVGDFGGNNCTTAFAGGETIDAWCRSGVVATAPSGTTWVRMIIETTHTAQLDPYVFMVRAYLGEAGPTQEELSPWGAAGTTSINNGLIETDAINARVIAADSITASELAANSITAADILAGTITSTEIAANTINVGQLNATGFGDNVIKNGAFEGATATAALSGWKKDTSSSTSAAGLQNGCCGLYGPGTMLLDHGNGFYLSAVSKAFPVVAGQTYRVSGSIYAGASSNTYHLVVYGSSSTASAVSYVVNNSAVAPDVTQTSATFLVLNGGTAAGWNVFEYTYTVPAGLNWASLVFYNLSGTVGGSTYTAMHVDNVEMQKQIGPGHIVANSITAGQIAAGTITANELSANSVDTSELVAGAVTAGKINVSSLSAITADLGTVTAGAITGLSITGGTITGTTITGVTVTGSSSVTGATVTGGTININSGAFEVQSNGNTSTTALTNSGTITTGGFLADVFFQLVYSGFTAAGNHHVCHDNSGVFFGGASCDAVSPAMIAVRSLEERQAVEMAQLQAEMAELRAEIAALKSERRQ